jgi:hypothetical protein
VFCEALRPSLNLPGLISSRRIERSFDGGKAIHGHAMLLSQCEKVLARFDDSWH